MHDIFTYKDSKASIANVVRLEISTEGELHRQKKEGKNFQMKATRKYCVEILPILR